jgi:hypothetical protein
MKTSVFKTTSNNKKSNQTMSGRKWILPVVAAFTGMLIYSGIGFAAKGGIPGPPSGEETANNLSLPGVVIGSATTVPHNWTPPASSDLGVHYSYGCDQPESDGQYSYPNTSCVNNLSEPTEYYDASACTDDIPPSPCQGLDVSRIYWQKVPVNQWWADDEGTLDTTPLDPFRSVAYVDWGDALEAVTANERSFIRVETQPYTSLIPGFDPTVTYCEEAAIAASLDAEDVCKVGLQMWHVSGQGITEHWGVRASDTPNYDSYNYDSPFQIIKSTNARLNLAKMAQGSALCPEAGGNPGEDPPLVGDWDPIEAVWGGTCRLSDEPFSVELSVGGKYVYGANWRLRDVDMVDTDCPNWLKTGYWRLTFYVPMGVEVNGDDVILTPRDIIFDDDQAPNVAPPASPAEVRTLPRSSFNTALAPVDAPPPEAVLLINGIPVLEEEDPDADDRLYKPVIDTVNNLSYIDICVTGKTKGGGKTKKTK